MIKLKKKIKKSLKPHKRNVDLSKRGKISVGINGLRGGGGGGNTLLVIHVFSMIRCIFVE